ncbi:Hypothetical predicted protein [Mytilus galloprovincialis]|uniref:DDE-1 domain-containing protein n=1 Tax=Mytilus galloprovincialis TaxID=29158 RepID=A0A8B6D418_MYTGA|nr:Hypothetical predicted protein [Mytilus galloprovincialis]
MDAKMGASTVLTSEDEISLVNYIEYMAQRGFPRSVSQVIGFAWCIAKEHPGARVFNESGPTEKWWRGFKKRQPKISLRRPDPLDRGRAAMGNVETMRDYFFKLLKSTLETNDLKDKPERLYNCDEAGLSLNKSSGPRVVVPKRFKHAHSISILQQWWIPGGAYHKNGPINAAYATTDSGFMDKETYFQWFEKVFLQHCVKERPIMLLQDGAISHISPMLIDSALKNDVILLCLPSKTTHILQPLDVAVYKNMKIETTKQVSNAKMLKSDLWVSKKNVSSIFKVIFEGSFTMACITQGFKKCGIYPFDPNAIDKTLLFRGGNDVNPDDLDLS